MSTRLPAVAVAGATVAVLAVVTTALVGRQPAAEPASLVLRNGRIATMDDARPQAQALAARGDKIVTVGTDDEVAKLIGPKTQVIDLQRAVRDAGLHREPRAFHGRRRVADVAEPDEREELGRDRRDGGRGRDEGQAGRLDPGPRLAPGEVEATARCPTSKGFPVHDALSKVSPEQSRASDARQRTRDDSPTRRRWSWPE